MSKNMYMFSYGMNTNPKAMVFDSLAKPIGVGTLFGYQLDFAVHATINDGNKVLGVVWEIDEETLLQLDYREGYPDYYTRFIVPIKLNKTGKTINAIVYQMLETYSNSPASLPSPKYLKMLTIGYTHFGIPISQILEALTRIDSTEF